jgi:hypothetical protein
MTLSLRSLPAILSAVLFAAPAAAQVQPDPVIFAAGSETTDRYNPGTSGTDYTLYQGVYIHAPGATQARINSVSVGIRRTATVSSPAPPVEAEISIREMTWQGITAGVGQEVAKQTVQLLQTTATTTATYTVTWGENDLALRPIVNLQRDTDGDNGYGAFWVGLRFVGANANSNANAWRVVNMPGAPTVANPLALGRCHNSFGLLNMQSGFFGWNFTRGQATGSDGVLRDLPCRMMVSVRGAPVDPGTTPGDLLCGNACSDPSRYSPPLAASGTASEWVMQGALVAAAPGKYLKPRSVRVGLGRVGSSASPAPAVDLELALFRMTWVNGTYGFAPTPVASIVYPLAPASSASTQMIDWTFPTDGPPAYVQLETDAVENSGGLWVAARFVGPGAQSAANALALGYAPVLGQTFNNLRVVEEDGSWVTVTTGTYSNSTTNSPQPKPSRMLVELSGEIVDPPPPCPADFNGDGIVTGADLGLLLGAWGPCPSGECIGDLNLDGAVTGADLGLLLGAWGPCL